MAINVKMRNFENYQLELLKVPIASATVVAVGDLISYESGKAVLLNAEAEDATFVGVAVTASANGDTTDLVVATKAIVEATVTSAAFAIGDSIGLNAGGTSLEASADNTLMYAWEDTGGVSVTTLKCLVDIVRLGKLFVTAA